METIFKDDKPISGNIRQILMEREIALANFFKAKEELDRQALLVNDLTNKIEQAISQNSENGDRSMCDNFRSPPQKSRKRSETVPTSRPNASTTENDNEAGPHVGRHSRTPQMGLSSEQLREFQLQTMKYQHLMSQPQSQVNNESQSGSSRNHSDSIGNQSGQGNRRIDKSANKDQTKGRYNSSRRFPQ